MLYIWVFIIFYFYTPNTLVYSDVYYQNEYTVVHERMEVDYLNKEYFAKYDIVNDKYNRTTRTHSINGTLLKPATSSWMFVLKAFVFVNNEYKSFPALRYTQNICFILENNILSLRDALAERSNINPKCPMQPGEYYVKNIIIDETNLPPHLPAGRYRIQFSYVDRKTVTISYSCENPIQPDLLTLGDDNALRNSHFDFYKPTVLFFHAFFETYTSLAATTIRTAYLQRKDHNVILLEAPRLEAGPWYLTAARNTRVVGEYTAAFIDYLVSRGLYLPSLHLIGLSLGAQMAGVCGQNVKSGRIQRITGLDPAGPLFTKWPRNLKLDKGDAEFVDIIHTDAGIFGYPRSIGHADFWPNKGISPQPGCTIREVKMRSPDSILEPFFCSHWRSYMFYAESVVTPNSFLSTNCKNWGDFTKGKCNQNQLVNMGFSLTPEARGNYYLTTRSASPFSLQTPPPQAMIKIVMPQQTEISTEVQDEVTEVQEDVTEIQEEVTEMQPQYHDNNNVEYYYYQ